MGRRAILILCFLLLIAAAVNVPLAVQLQATASKHAVLTLSKSPSFKVREQQWPAKLPEGWEGPTEWPTPNLWKEKRAFGYTMLDVSYADSWEDPLDPDWHIYSMDIEQAGWPLPVVARHHITVDFGRDHSSYEDWRLRWSGVILNPLIVGGGLWLVTVAPLTLFFVSLAHSRRRRGLCSKCGYPLGASKRCPECGVLARW